MLQIKLNKMNLQPEHQLKARRLYIGHFIKTQNFLNLIHFTISSLLTKTLPVPVLTHSVIFLIYVNFGVLTSESMTVDLDQLCVRME